MSDAINRGRLSFEIQDADKTYEQQPYKQVGDDSYHVDLYGEIEAELRANAPETLTDSNCIFIDGISGNDSTGSGAEASPYKTVSKGVEVFFVQASRVKKYLCLKGYSYFCEDVQIPRWLEDYIYCESSTATAIGNVDLSGGHDWSAGSESMLFYSADAPYPGTTINLTANCANLAAIISHVNTQLNGAGINDIEAYDAGSNYIGIRKTTSGEYIFCIRSSVGAADTLGLVLGLYIGKEKIRIRRVERNLPAVINNTNTKFVADTKFTGSPYDGTILNPYLYIGEALNDITTVDFVNVAVKANGNEQTVFEIKPDYYRAATINRYANWTPTATITQTVNIFPYYSNTGHDLNPGFSLYIGGSLERLNLHLPTTARFQNYKKYQYIVSRNFHTSNEKEIIFCNYNTNTYCIERTSDFKTISTQASTSTKNWCGICEYYYNGYWYLLVCADDGGSAMRIFHYRSDGGDTGEITVSLTNTASTTKRHYFMSDGNNAFMVCYDSSKSYIFLAKNNVDITTNSNWVKLYEGTDNIRLFQTPDNEFYWIEDGKTNIYKYDGISDYDEYNFGIQFKLLFKVNNIYYCLGQTIDYNCKLYYINFDTSTASYTGKTYGGDPEEMRLVIYFNQHVYFTAADGSGFYQFDERFERGELDTSTCPTGITTLSDGLSAYQVPTFNGIIFGLSDEHIEDEICIAQLTLFGKANISGFYFLPNLDDDDFGLDLTPKVNLSIAGNNITTKYDFFNSVSHPIINKESMLTDISSCVFSGCEYPVILEGYADYDVEFCLFSDYITAIHYQCLSDAEDEPLSINNCTAYNGTTFFEEDIRSVNTDEQSTVDECFISKTAVSVKSYADMAVNVTNSILYPYSTSLNAEIDDDSLFAIPLFQDPENNDFRLKTISAGYQYNSAGYQASDTTETATGKDYNWNAYSSQNIDLGAMVVLDPIFRTEQWETITLDYSPQSFQIDYVQQDTSINRTLQNTAYKVTPKIYRQFTYQYRSDNSFDLKNIQRIRRLMEQTTKFKLFMNPLLDYDPSECATGDVGWQSGNWAIASMVIATGIAMEKGQYDNLFVRIHDSGDIYEYRIIDTDASGNLTLEDYWEVGDMSDGTYNTEISYALVFYDTSTLQNKNQVYGGINYNDSVPLAGQTLKFIEAI